MGMLAYKRKASRAVGQCYCSLSICLSLYLTLYWSKVKKDHQEQCQQEPWGAKEKYLQTLLSLSPCFRLLCFQGAEEQAAQQAQSLRVTLALLPNYSLLLSSISHMCDSTAPRVTLPTPFPSK